MKSVPPHIWSLDVVCIPPSMCIGGISSLVSGAKKMVRQITLNKDIFLHPNFYIDYAFHKFLNLVCFSGREYI